MLLASPLAAHTVARSAARTSATIHLQLRRLYRELAARDAYISELQARVRFAASPPRRPATAQQEGDGGGDSGPGRALARTAGEDGGDARTAAAGAPLAQLKARQAVRLAARGSGSIQQLPALGNSP